MNGFATPSNSAFLNRRIQTEDAESSEDPLFWSAFEHDRDRIIHSRAFRRLMHKTQIFNSKATPHKWQDSHRRTCILWKSTGCPMLLLAGAHWFKLPGRACQPESDSLTRTWYWIWLFAFRALGIVFFGNAAVSWRCRIRAPLSHEQRT